MNTVRPGGLSALVVVDVQAGVMAGCWQAARVVAKVALAVARAREAGAPVLWVQHMADDLPHGSAAWQLVPELLPAAGEARVDKRFPSSFEQTALETLLARDGVSHIVLAGAQTNWCIRATAYAALDRGYDLSLLDDAHTTESVALDDGQRIEASGIVADLNLCMTWLRYPGRTCAAEPAHQVVFTGGAGRG